jgi:pilus assembly protein Flp/PilA
LKSTGALVRQGNHGENCMRRLSKSVANWLTIESERGVTAIEYGLIASLVALAIIVGLTLVGVNLGGLFTYIGGKVAPPT